MGWKFKVHVLYLLEAITLEFVFREKILIEEEKYTKYVNQISDERFFKMLHLKDKISGKSHSIQKITNFLLISGNSFSNS